MRCNFPHNVTNRNCVLKRDIMSFPAEAYYSLLFSYFLNCVTLMGSMQCHRIGRCVTALHKSASIGQSKDQSQTYAVSPPPLCILLTPGVVLVSIVTICHPGM